MIIEGIPSGDLECWCLLVTRETFIELTGKKPHHKWDVGRFAKKGSPYRYMIYPHSLFSEDPQVSIDKEKLLVISVDVIEKKKLT